MDLLNCTFEILTLSIGSGIYTCAVKAVATNTKISYSLVYGTHTITAEDTEISFFVTTSSIGVVNSEIIYSYIEQSIT
jgi:hypothetical protein